jgi:dihydrofolate reductase
MKSSVFVGASLDGFIARANGDFDFLFPSGNEPHGYEEFIATVDAIVMGRNTFEVVRRMTPWPYATKSVFVLSSRPLAATPQGITVSLMGGTPAEIVSRLAASGAHHLYVDGGITIQRFLRAGLVHRLVITRVPVIIGTGIPLFGPTRRDIALEHIATRTFITGLVQSEYAVLSKRAAE